MFFLFYFFFIFVFFSSSIEKSLKFESIFGLVVFSEYENSSKSEDPSGIGGCSPFVNTIRIKILHGNFSSLPGFRFRFLSALTVIISVR